MQPGFPAFLQLAFLRVVVTTRSSGVPVFDGSSNLAGFKALPKNPRLGDLLPANSRRYALCSPRASSRCPQERVAAARCCRMTVPVERHNHCKKPSYPQAPPRILSSQASVLQLNYSGAMRAPLRKGTSNELSKASFSREARELVLSQTYHWFARGNHHAGTCGSRRVRCDGGEPPCGPRQH